MGRFEGFENLLRVVLSSVGVLMGDREDVYGSSKDTREATLVSILGILRRVEGVAGCRDIFGCALGPASVDDGTMDGLDASRGCSTAVGEEERG